jgi:molybdopterin/thiamine biosynthesis adenylyltransferase/proteasome lid subunit RPN8/RPN11
MAVILLLLALACFLAIYLLADNDPSQPPPQPEDGKDRSKHDEPAPLWTRPFPPGIFAANPPQTLRMTRSVLDEIKRTIGNQPAEQGGMLGGQRQDGVVRQFVFDQSAQRDCASYSPNCDFLKQLLREQWNPADINLLGFVHSHPASCRSPSNGDLEYAERILQHNPEMPLLLLPIVQSRPNSGRFELLPFAAVRDGDKVRVIEMNLDVIEDRARPAIAQPAVKKLRHPVHEPVVQFDDAGSSLAETFTRVGAAYDLSRLASSRIVAVGTGGAAQFLEDMARAGLAEFILLDPDTVSESNLATQQVYRRDLGRPKVDCLAERIHDINPHAHVVALAQRLDDLDDAELTRLASTPLRTWKCQAGPMWGMAGVSVPVEVAIAPARTVLCGFTDNFEAQARVNRLALQLGLPSLSAQVYHEGRGAEITFTFPGVTQACQRCALSSRYKEYLHNGFKNNVTSDGTPIFATARLNALKGFVLLALLHHGSDHPRWGKLLERIGHRNLIQIRMDPDLPLKTFAKVFAGADSERVLFDDVIWLPQKPDCPANGFPLCPDCGGTADLRNAIGTFDDTRAMRR